MRQHSYANTSAQQQPRRLADRQQQQCSGAADYNLLPAAAAAPQVNAGTPAQRVLRLVSAAGAVQAA
ncbi:MAG: hypothetical protein J0H69_14415 [Burkholderiales bacterium]|jgi:hypothetical protein|nr:hypothetical protein [Burkholderiales bacterium]